MSAECMIPMAKQLAKRSSADDEGEGVALLALVEAERSWKPGGLSLEEWCRLGVQNALANWKRSEYVRRHLPLIEGLHAEVRDTVPRLSDIIATLPGELQALASLKWEHKWSDQDIRGFLECSWERYSQMLARAKELAKRYLENLTCAS